MTNKKFAVLGSPIEHSLSPSIHLAAYKCLALDWSYEKVEVHAGDLESFVKAQKAYYSGFSVTMPLKVEAAYLANEKDWLVEQLGVANTLVLSDEGIAAFNTDVFGINKSLESFWETGVQSIALLGAGATARSALMAIHDKAPEAKVAIYVRESSNTDAITALGTVLGISTTIESLDSITSNHDLTINTVPGAALPIPSTARTGWFLDVNYADLNKQYVDTFDPSKVVSGKSMLLWQAIGQIRLFTTKDATLELPNEAEVLRAMTSAL